MDLQYSKIIFHWHEITGSIHGSTLFRSGGIEKSSRHHPLSDFSGRLPIFGAFSPCLSIFVTVQKYEVQVIQTKVDLCDKCGNGAINLSFEMRVRMVGGVGGGGGRTVVQTSPISSSRDWNVWSTDTLSTEQMSGQMVSSWHYTGEYNNVLYTCTLRNFSFFVRLQFEARVWRSRLFDPGSG